MVTCRANKWRGSGTTAPGEVPDAVYYFRVWGTIFGLKRTNTQHSGHIGQKNSN